MFLIPIAADACTGREFIIEGHKVALSFASQKAHVIAPHGQAQAFWRFSVAILVRFVGQVWGIASASSEISQTSAPIVV